MKNLNKINIFLLLAFLQFFLYSSQDQKDKLLDAFIPDANVAKIISDYTVDWQLHKTIDTGVKRDISSFDISADGKYLASGYMNGKVKVWLSETGNLIKEFTALPNQQIIYLALSQPDGKYLAASDPEWSFNQTKIFVSKTGKELHTIFDYSYPTYLRDGKYFAAANDNHNIRIFNTSDYSIIKEIPFNVRRANFLVFAPNSKYLAYTSRAYSSPSSYSSSLTILNIDTSKEEYISGSFLSGDFSNNSKFFAGGTDEGQAKIWDVQAQKLIHTFLVGTRPIDSLTFSLHDKYLAVASGAKLKIWDFSTKNLIKEITEKDEYSSIKFVKFLPNNFLIYVLGDQIKIWKYEGIE